MNTNFPQHCGIKQNLAVWSMGRWQYYNVDYIEPLPGASSVSTINYGAVAASSSVAITELTQFDVDEHQLLQLRFYPIDDIEVRLWEARSQSRFSARSIQARATPLTRRDDPDLLTTEFNVLGRDRNAFIEVINNNPYALTRSRVVFLARRYILIPLANVVEQVDGGGILRASIQAPGCPVQPLIAQYVVAEGRAS